MKTNKEYLECLQAMFNDCKQHGLIQRGLRVYFQTYGVNPNLGKILQKIGVIQKMTDGYKWNAREPDEALVIEIRGFMSKVFRKRRFPESTPISEQPNLFPLELYSEILCVLPPELALQRRMEIAKQFAKRFKNSV